MTLREEFEKEIVKKFGESIAAFFEMGNVRYIKWLENKLNEGRKDTN